MILFYVLHLILKPTKYFLFYVLGFCLSLNTYPVDLSASHASVTLLAAVKSFPSTTSAESTGLWTCVSETVLLRFCVVEKSLARFCGAEKVPLTLRV